jgi:hypothetical protein
VLRRDAREAFHQIRRHRLRLAGIERVVRIAKRVHVAHRPVHSTRGHLKHLHAARGVDEPARAADHVRVVGALHHHVGPGVQLEAIDDQHVGPPQLEHEAGPDLDVVDILCAARERIRFHQVAAHRLRERLQIGDGRHHAEPRGLGDTGNEAGGDERHDGGPQPGHQPAS